MLPRDRMARAGAHIVACHAHRRRVSALIYALRVKIFASPVCIRSRSRIVSSWRSSCELALCVITRASVWQVAAGVSVPV